MVPRNEYQKLFEATPNPYLVLTPDFRVTGVNSAYLCATMTRREAILGRRVFDIFPGTPDDHTAEGRRNLTASLSRVLQERRADTMAVQRFDIQDPDGNFAERHWRIVNTPLTNDQDEVVFILHAVTDVTASVLAADVPSREPHSSDRDRIRNGIVTRNEQLPDLADASGFNTAKADDTQNALIRQQRLEAIGRLTGGVAHDFNNLLTAILGNLSLLERRYPRASDEARLVRSASRAASRGANLTRQLLAFGRCDTLHPQVVEVDELVEEMRMLLEQAAGDDIELIVDPAAPGCACFVDATHLESAILNLALNARHAMPDGGALTIATGCIDHEVDEPSEEWPSGQYVYVTVADEGMGMSPEVQERAFEPFFTTKQTGTGLGLSQVYGFAKQSNGHVAIESAVGAGTSITLYLPRSYARPVRKAAETPEPSAMPSGRTILIVEDDPDVRQALMRNVAAIGYRVKAAVDGYEAISLLAGEDHFDAIIVDVVMPHGISGVEVAKEARRVRSDIKILLTSGSSEEALGAEGAAVTGFHLLMKPYHEGELARELSRLFTAEPF